MQADDITVTATKPFGRPARMLAEQGIRIAAAPEDEGNVDRYALSRRLVLERRTGSSFLRGIMEKTLFTSAIYMREHFRIPVLVVEGEVNYAYTGFDPQAVRGALSSMMIEYGLNVLATPNVDETVALIALMARQEQVGIPEISLIPKRKAVELADQQRRVVEMLPGCGMVLARDLLQHFGSVQRIFRASASELRAVRGMGVQKARVIDKVVNAEYEAVDTERDLEDAVCADPALLFECPVRLIARQHCIFTEERERHVVDLVFEAEHGARIVLVELKRGRLGGEHERQLVRYLENAPESRLLRRVLAGGAKLDGVLATVTPCAYRPRAAAVKARVVDRGRVIAVLKALRRERLGHAAQES